MLAAGIPTAFDLYPGQTYRLSFGALGLAERANVLALANFARFDEPDVRFAVASAAAFGAVPEPTTLSLFACAALILSLRRRWSAYRGG